MPPVRPTLLLGLSVLLLATTAGSSPELQSLADVADVEREELLVDALAFESARRADAIEDERVVEAVQARALHYLALSPRIVNGVKTQLFPTAGALLDGGDPSDAGSLCSGTLVGCNTFVTAAHCVDPDPDPNSYSVFFQHAGFFRVTSIAIHPDFQFPVADLAVLTLAGPVTGISPSPIHAPPPLTTGVVADIVGFGRTGGVFNDYGIKRSGSVTVSSCSGGISDVTSICWQFTGSGANTCNGDSGGGLYRDRGNDPPLLVGVTSGGTNATCLPTDASFDTRISQYRDWILQQVAEPLGGDACMLPDVGAASVQVGGLVDVLDSSRPIRISRFQVTSGTELRFALNGLDELDGFGNRLNDFDLHVRHLGIPTTPLVECLQEGSSTFGYCEFRNPPPGVWEATVSLKQGSGAYQLTSVLFR